MSAVSDGLEPMRLALVGVPNCGKTALFNRLTGSRQKVANYAGVTVERKEGSFVGPGGRRYRLLDLPGAYSLTPTTLDEAITRDCLLGRLAGEPAPERVICVMDATNLRLNLRLVLELRDLGVPLVVALNMSDLAHGRGFRLDRARLEQELGVPVVETVAIREGGARALLERLESLPPPGARGEVRWHDPTFEQIQATQRNVRRILHAAGYAEPARRRALRRLDALVLHPVAGPAILAALLFFVFQAVFSWAARPMQAVDAGVTWVGAQLHAALPDGALRSLLVDGVVAGAGSVLVFLPQILILFFFILVLEDSGYLPRAVRGAGHHGHAHDPQRPRPARHDHDRTAHDLLGAAARVRGGDRRVHSEPAGRSLQPAGTGALHALRRGHNRGDDRGVGTQAHHPARELPPAAARVARVQVARPA